MSRGAIKTAVVSAAWLVVGLIAYAAMCFLMLVITSPAFARIGGL